jgi:hypothetical protein
MYTYYGYFDCILQDPRAYVDLKRWASAALQSHNPQQETPLIKQVGTIMTYIYIYIYIYIYTMIATRGRTWFLQPVGISPYLRWLSVEVCVSLSL